MYGSRMTACRSRGFGGGRETTRITAQTGAVASLTKDVSEEPTPTWKAGGTVVRGRRPSALFDDGDYCANQSSAVNAGGHASVLPP